MFCVLCVLTCFFNYLAVVQYYKVLYSLLFPQVLHSLRLLLMMKPPVLSRVSREVAYGLHELLKTNAANIHCTDHWFTLFSLLECIGAGVKPPSSFQIPSTTADNDTGSNTPLIHDTISKRL